MRIKINNIQNRIFATSAKKFMTLAVNLRKPFINLCVFFMFLCTITTAAQVTIKADTTKIRIGEQFNYQIEVTGIKGVEFYKLKLDSLQKIEVIKSHKIDTLKEKLIKKYTLTSFDSGRYTLPKQLVKIFSKPIFTDSLVVDVSTVAVDTLKQPLFPIKSIQHQKFTIKDYAKSYWYLLLIPILLGLIWYFFFKDKETEEERIAKIPPFQMAVQQLENLDKKLLWQNNKTKQYYSELTDIIRTYIEKELKAPALESTTNELVNSIKKFNNSQKLNISKKTILKLKDLLQEADLVKFAKSKPFANEIEMHRKYADVILEGLKPDEDIEIPENPNLINTDVDLNISIDQNNAKHNIKSVQRISKKKKRNIIIISIFTLFLIGGIYFGKKVYDGVMNKIGNTLDASSSKELIKTDWKVQKFGNPALVAEFPITLSRKELPLPNEIKKVIVSMKAFGYKSIINNLQFAVIATTYNPEMSLNLQGAVNGSISNMKSKKEISELKYKVEQLNKLGINGARVYGTFKENNTTVDFEFQIFIKNNKTWMILIGNKLNDNFGQQIKQRILNSVNIETNNAN